ncbi:MAG: PAS-domain containing protein, partial [Myxococcota bacterium]
MVLVFGSLLSRPGLSDRVQAAAFVHGEGEDRFNVWSKVSATSVGDLRRVTQMFLDENRLKALENAHHARAGEVLADDDDAPDWMMIACERALGAVLGVASARNLLLSLSEHRRLEIEEVVQLVDGTAQAMRFNRSLLFTSLENLAHGVSVVDKDLRLVGFNQRYLDFFEYPAGFATVGRPVAELVRFNLERSDIPEHEIEEHLERRISHLRRGTSYTTRHTVRGRVLELSGRPLAEGGFVTTFSDITEHVAAKEALQRINETLEETVEARTREIVEINRQLEEAKHVAEAANAAKTQFLMTAGHDILQPLSAARMFLSAALESKHAAPLLELLKPLGGSLEATEELIADLYDIAKLDQGAIAPTCARIALGPLLGQLVDEARPRAESKGLNLRYVESRAVVFADPSYTRRIVRNFIDNAIKYTEHGKVLVGARRRGDRVAIEIWDSGLGIPAAEHDAVFDDFYRRDEARTEAGSGLGLAVVRRMAEAMEARVELRSEEGLGSCFSPHLQRLDGSSSQPVARPTPASAWGLDSVSLVYVD